MTIKEFGKFEALFQFRSLHSDLYARRNVARLSAVWLT
jgi:hypothetical protein